VTGTGPRVAKAMIKAKRPDVAKDHSQTILTEYPNTKAAAEAKGLPEDLA
jgi:hypothetical protein